MAARVAVLGLGAMGSRIAQRLATAGFDVVTWSRSSTTPLARATSIAEAVTGADVVLSMVRDDEASTKVWGEAFLHARPGALVIECSTVSPARAEAWGAQAHQRGLLVLEAPVVGSRPQADAGTLVVLAGGTGEALERARPLLSTFAGAVHPVGRIGDGARCKLLVNGLFATQVALLGELFTGAARAGLDPARLLDVLGSLPVLSAAAKAAATGQLAQRFEPQFPIDLVAKDLRYATDAFTSEILTAVRRRFEAASAAGFGALNLTAVARLP
ncbi:MAG: NAD(P)-dependent oxidoreductase [Myxococcaceae bacterium]|nr:NAD(P)-dependent oxidoreductase [Myxococcaceae bacterium]